MNESDKTTEKRPVRVYYLSSGVIGNEILDALATDDRIDLVGVGSQIDRPCGRKQVLTPTEFAKHALETGHEVERVPSVNDESFLARLRALDLDVLLVVAFGQLLKAAILALPRFGCMNVHASVLPHYRGACPINAAILNGDAETGVTFMRMDKGLDTGPVYCASTLPIGERETAGELEVRLGRLAATQICDVLWRVVREGLSPKEQSVPEEKNLRKISKQDGAIDWSMNAATIDRMVRGYQPWPKAFSFIPVQGQLKRIQITEATAEISQGEGDAITPAGTVLAKSDAETLCVACGNGTCLRLKRVIPEGRREMPVSDFLRGTAVAPGTQFVRC